MWNKMHYSTQKHDENTVHVKSLITEKIALKIYTCNWIYCFFVKNIRDILKYPKIL